MTPSDPTTDIGRIRAAVFNYAVNTYSKRFGAAPPANILADIDPSLDSLEPAAYDVVVSELAGILTNLGLPAHLQPQTLKENGDWSSLSTDLEGSID